ncbi:MAG: phosphoesterase RecJ-like protein [Candidatus Marinamargulisbacteria bacterium]|jgi:phosphoesterase RecJ-like protein
MPEIPESQRFSEHVEKVKKAVIVAHEYPDFDAIGSVLSLRAQLVKRGIEVVVRIPDIIRDVYDFLPFSDQIVRKVPDGFSFDTLFVLDCSNPNRVKNFNDLKIDAKRVTIVNMDHHADNTRFGDINLVTSEISSVGELLATVFRSLSWSIDRDIATCLFSAMSYDTGRFSYSNVTNHTLARAAELVAEGADVADISSRMYENFTEGTFQVLKEALGGLIVNRELGYAYTTMNKHLTDSRVKIIDFIRMLNDIDVVMVFREVNSNCVKISLRSKEKFDVQTFSAQFGGGGHKRASGIVLTGKLADVEKKVVEKLNDALTLSK